MDDFYRQVTLDLSNASLLEQGMLRLKVTSQSMSPLLLPGDYVLVKPTSTEAIRRGDLLVTRREEGYLTHRLIAIDERGWRTKGDQNGQADAPVEVTDIVGLVVAYERLEKIHSLRTQMRVLVARLLGWLGWREITSRTQLGKWSARVMSRVLQYISR